VWVCTATLVAPRVTVLASLNHTKIRFVAGSNSMGPFPWTKTANAGVAPAPIIRASRGAKVIAEIMGEQQAECWVCDCFSAQLKAPAQRRQLCLAHQLRDLQRLLE
jgi:hypothetical protein